MKHIPLFLLLLYPCLTAASDDDPAVANVDTHDVFVSPGPNPILTLPQKVWNLFPVYPLGKLTIYAERSRLPQRAYNWFTNEDHSFGLFPYLQLGGETGTGLGFTTFHRNVFSRGKLFNGSYIFAAPQRQTASARYRDPAIAASAFYWNLDARYLRTDAEDASVNGILDEGRIALLKTAEIDLTSALGWHSNAGPLEAYRPSIFVEIRSGWGRRDLQLQRGAPIPLAGLDEVIHLAWGGFHLGFDDRDYKTPTPQITHPLNYILPGRVLIQHQDRYYSQRDLGYPERGGLLYTGLDLVLGTQETRFWRLSADAQRFFTLFWTDRILALRARLDKVGSLDDGIVPYTDLPALGGSQRLRGYKRSSFRGQGALLLSAEYRWPIWDTWNAYLFWDEGHIFNDFDDIQRRGFRSSFGGGLSLRTEQALLLSLRLSHSAREDALLGFALEQEF